MKEKRSILAIGAHPDDIEFSCGGTLFKFSQRGYDIYYAIATNGENGFKIEHRPRNERVKVRYSEQLNAARLLNVKKVYFLHYKDGFLPDNFDLRKRLVNVIKKTKPEIIFTFDPANMSFDNLNLNHRDHRIIGEAVFDAAFAARNRYMYPGEPHALSSFYFFGCSKPNHFENITRFIQNKISLIKEHRSQFQEEKGMADWVKKILSSYTKKYRFSEQFRIVKIQKVFTSR